jgi:16S rRNA (adenine1518-N6/adenine1519-N6)-dimethyltransferase
MGERLGQNFLKDENVVKKIIQVADLKKDDVVLEVGPGKGVLTEELAKNAGKVLAVEIDGSLLNTLRGKLSNFENVEIINVDILKLNFGEFYAKYKIQDTKYKVIANIPYYITSKIIRLFLEADNPPSEMILMVQKEVAERIVAKPGQMSILAASVQYYAEAEILFEVPREAFDPAPEVDSAVIRIKNYEPRIENNEDSRRFFRVVKAGFCARRKTLVNNLSNSLHLDKKEVEEKMKTIGISPIARAQELSIEDWKKLSNIF